MIDLKKVSHSFKIEGSFLSGEPFGCGHINDTFALVFGLGDGKQEYIFQRINHNVFPDVEGLMNNIFYVTEFLYNVIKKDGGNASRECLEFIETRDGKYFHVDDEGRYWRAYHKICNAHTYQIADDAETYGDGGKAFGKFIARLSDFPVEKLVEIIPNFHNTAVRLDNFRKSLETNYNNRTAEVVDEINFVLDRDSYGTMITEKLATGTIPTRVTHNDTKLNNVLFDDETKKAICVIDLDTIMPGSLAYDFGDAVRSGCSTALEDEKNLDIVHFDLNLFDSFTKGFLSGIGDNITGAELELLPYAGIIMTFECGTRFLTDFLSGDTYFKTAYPEHNLVRARTQFKLVSEMEENIEQMTQIVKNYSK